MSRPHWRILAILVLVVGLAFVVGCADDSDSQDNGTPVNCDDIEEMLADAETALENTLYQELNSDPDQPSDIDFSAARTLYQAAYQCDPSSNDARMGLAVTGMLSILTNAEVNAAFDEWEAYLESSTPFEVDKSQGYPLGIPLGIASGRPTLFLPFDIVATSLLANSLLADKVADPQLSRAQNIFRNLVIPQMQTAIDMMAPVAQSSNYVFHVTGRMQGDDDASTKEMDQTDVIAMRAACLLLQTACRLACAYNVDFSSYDETGMLAALDRNSGTFLRLSGGGADQMRAVPGAVTGAIDLVSAAITSLLNETDNQSDDIIKTDPYDMSESELLELRDETLPDIRQAFTTGYTITEDWDDDWSTPDVPVTFHLGAFFANPITDWKLVLPPYTVTTEQRPWDQSWAYFYNEHESIIVPIASDGWYSAYYSRYVYDFDSPSTYWSGDAAIVDAIADLVDDHVDEVVADEDWAGDYSFYASVYQYATAPADTFSVWLSGDYSLAESQVVVPVITWEATTFAGWRDGWTNYTLNGLLPDMGSASEVFETFGLDAEGWEPTLVIDWTEFDEPW